MTHDTKREEQVLDTLLRALIAHREARTVEIRPLRFVRFDEWTGRQIPTRAQSDAAELLRDPVGASLRQGVTRIGEHLFRTLGSTGAMKDVAARAADLDPAWYSYRASILDHAWDGIGIDGDRWAA